MPTCHLSNHNALRECRVGIVLPTKCVSLCRRAFSNSTFTPRDAHSVDTTFLCTLVYVGPASCRTHDKQGESSKRYDNTSTPLLCAFESCKMLEVGCFGP